MPLITGKSPKAFTHNLKAEIKAGKPMKQSLAIAYAQKRKANKMADGGDVDSNPDSSLFDKISSVMGSHASEMQDLQEDGGEEIPATDPSEGGASTHNMSNDELAQGTEMIKRSRPEYAFGGDVVDRIMAKRGNHTMMSKGGMVANEGEDELSDMADGKPNEFDDLSMRDYLEFSDTGASAGDELGDAQEDEDRSDIVAKIMRQRSMKQRNPRPA
jgi:hypothetical protein